MNPALLISLGPSILRTVGAMFGGKTKQTTDKVADLMDVVKGKPNAPEIIGEAVERMSKEDRLAFAAAESRLAEIAADLEKTKDTNAHKTIQTELEQGNDYVKETRPWIARQSFIMGSAYAILATMAHWLEITTTGADVALLGVLYSPVGVYMTMRTVDGFGTAGRT